MAAGNRSAQFGKLHKILKKSYKSFTTPADRPVLEHLLFACCLEDARYEAAEEAFAALKHTFFDWNEVRVTSISELSEVMTALPDPRAAANRVKRVLHGIFEESYSFDLEDKRKKNLGPTVKWLEKLDGSSRFCVAYVIQAALGGHSIPVDTGTMTVLRILDMVTDKDVAAGEIPGLERAIAKAKGVEFGSMLHQLGADFTANPFSPQVREMLLQVEPTAKDRFPQRRAVKESKPEGETAPATKKSAEKQPTEKHVTDKHAEKHPAEKHPSDKHAEKHPAEKHSTEKPAAAEATASAKKKKADDSHPASPPPAEGKKASAGAKKSADEATGSEKKPSRGESLQGKSAAAGLAKRKPR